MTERAHPSLAAWYHEQPTGEASPSPQLPPIGAERLIAAWLDGLSPDTIESYRFDMEAFARFVGLADGQTAGRLLLSRGNGEANLIALEFKNFMVKAGFAPATVNRRLAALRSFTRAARCAGLIPWVLEFDRVFTRPYKDTRGPGLEGVRKLLAAVATRTDAQGVRDQAILRLLYERGLRGKEVVGLDLEHVDLQRGRLFILGKWRKEREGEAFGRLSRMGLYKIVRKLGEAAGIRARPHGLRHAAITAALDAGQDIRSVQRFARHCDDSRRDFGKQVTDAIAEPNPGEPRPRRRKGKETEIVQVVERPLLMHALGLKRGEQNKNAKLSAAAVIEIRRRAAEGEKPTGLGRAFGVSPTQIQNIVARRSWAHVTGGAE